MATLQPGDIAARVGLDAQLVHCECEEAGLPFLADFVHPWKENFFFLLPRVDVDDVEAENSGRTEKEKRVAALLKWKARCGKEATYSALLSALLENGNVERAEALCQHLLRKNTLEKGATPLTPPPSTSPQPTTSTTSAPLQATPTPSPVRTFGEPSCGLEVEIEQLDEQFSSLECKALEIIKFREIPLKDVLNWIRFPPRSVRMHISVALQSETDRLCNAKSVDALFTILSTCNFCDHFHPNLLQYIASKLGDPDLNAQMDRYLANLRQFRVHTTLGDFMGKWFGGVPAGYTEFVLELGEKWRERTVEDLEQLRVRMSRTHTFGGFVPHLAGTRPGSILVILGLPQHLFPLNFRQKDLHDFLRGEDVLRVTVGGQCLLDLVQLVEYERQLFQLCRQGGKAKDLSHRLSQPGVSPNIFDKNGQSLLWVASYYGFVEFVQVLLEYGADVNLPNNNDFGESSLIIAASYGHLTTCQVLLDHGASVNFQNKEGVSSLYFACQKGHLDIVKLLLSRAASVDLPRDNGATPLYIASECGHTSIVEYLITKGASINKPKKDGTTPLYIASQEGHTAIVEVLVLKGANVDQPKKNGVTPLYIASQEGHTAIVEVLVLKGANVDQPTKDGSTPLIIACQNGHLEVAMALANKGANVNYQDEDGWSPVLYASGYGHPQVVEFLIQKGATVDLCIEGGRTALMWASFEGFEEIVGQLLTAGAAPDIQDEDGLTALMLATQGGHLGVVSALLQGGANPNITEKDSGWSALHFSAKEGKTEMAKLLLDRGADASLKDKTGVTPYQLAKLHHNEDICSMLNNYYNTTKEIAVTEEQEKQVKSFSQRIRGLLQSLKATLLSNRTEKEQKQKSIRKVATSESDKERVTAVVKSH